MTEKQKRTRRISRFIARVCQAKHDEHAIRRPGDKKQVKNTELRNHFLEDV